MANYKEIKAAYEAAQEASWKLRDATFDVSRMLSHALHKVGEFPQGVAFCYPVNTKTVDPNKKYSPEGATTYNNEERYWEFGHIIEVGYKDATFPKDYFRSVFIIKPTKSEVTISLKGCDLSFSLDLSTLREKQDEVNEFAGFSFDQIKSYYDQSMESWVSEKQSRQISFNQ